MVGTNTNNPAPQFGSFIGWRGSGLASAAAPTPKRGTAPRSATPSTNPKLEPADVGGVLDCLGSEFIHLLRKTPGFVAVLDGHEHRFVFANEAYQQLVGGRTLIGKTVTEALPEVANQQYPDRLDEVFSTGVPFHARCAETILRDDNGQPHRHYLDFVYEPVVAQDGTVVGIFVSGVETSAPLDEQEQLYYLMDQVPQMVWFQSADRQAYYNRHWREFTGAGSANGPEFERASLIHPEDRDQALAAWNLGRTGGEYEAEFRLFHHSGTYRWVLSRGLATRDQSGEISSWFGTCTDIHDRVKAEGKLHSLHYELGRSERDGAVEFLTNTLAHEINQPLAAARMYLSGTKRLASKNVADPMLTGVDEAQRQLCRIEEIIKHARSTVAGRSGPRENVSLISLAREAIALLQATQLCHGIQVETRARELNELVNVNPTQIEQVFTNILRNACQAMRHTTSVKSLTLSSRPGADGMVQVEVADSGPGMKIQPGDLQPLLPPNATSGMGLGLKLSRTIIQSYGGDLWWENNAQGGASFFFTLPKATSNDAFLNTSP